MNRWIISFIIGSIVSAAALAISFKNIPIQDILHSMFDFDYRWGLVSIALAYSSIVIRALRWQLIIQAVYNVSFRDVYNPVILSYFINCILPGRVGELVRPILLTKEKKIPFSFGIATLAADRFFDVTILLGLYIIVMHYLIIDPTISITFANITLTTDTLHSIGHKMFILMIILICMIIGFSIKLTRQMIIFLITFCFNCLLMIIPSRYESFMRAIILDPFLKIMYSFAEGLELIKHPRMTIMCFALTALTWFTSWLSFYTIAKGFNGIDLSCFQTLTLLIIVCFIVALPSVPGYWGIWEAGGMFAMALFGFTGESAAGFTLINHTIQLIPPFIAGFIAMTITGTTLFKLNVYDTSGMCHDKNNK